MINDKQEIEAVETPFHVVLTALYGTENSGVRYLSAHLRNGGIRVSVVFFREWRNNDNTLPDAKDTELFVNLIRDLRPRLVGFSFVSSFLKAAESLTDAIKREISVPVVWGGIHATACPDECLKTADYAIAGEGEGPLLDLCNAIKENEPVRGIRNLCHWENDQIKKEPLRPLMEDLNLLPHPDYSHQDKYLIDRGRVIRGDPARSGAEYRIYCSRGCPYSCSYCYNSILRRSYEGLGKYFRHRSPQHIISELEEALKLFPRLRRIKFDDDTAFGFGREWIERFAELYQKKIRLPFECLLHPSLLDEENLKILKNAGLVKVQVGIESAYGERMKEIFGRAPKEDKILKFDELNRHLKLKVVYDIIRDDPTATDDEHGKLFDFLMKLKGPFRLYLYSLVLFPGTVLAEELQKRGLICADDIEGRSTKALSQFRVSFDWPRPPGQIYWLSLYTLASKSLIPRGLLKMLSQMYFFRKHPYILYGFARFANYLTMATVGMEMLAGGELTIFKLRQYGNLKKLISQ